MLWYMIEYLMQALVIHKLKMNIKQGTSSTQR